MKRHIIRVAALAFASQAIVSADSLSSEYIRAEVDRAAKIYRGDFPSLVTVISFLDTYGSFDGAAPGAQMSLSLAVPQPEPSQMLVDRPNAIQSFVRP